MTTPLERLEQRWQDLALPFPLVNPSNQHIDANNLPDPWAGVLVMSEGLRHATLGSNPWIEETGRFVLGVFTKSGEGFTRNDHRVRSVVEAFSEWTSTDHLFSITRIDGPFDIDPEADGGWFRLGLEMNYRSWEQQTP